MIKIYRRYLLYGIKLFGTFQEELPDKPPVYGITRPVSTWNPIKINFQHLWLLIKDAWHTKSWKDKLRIWFMPTGWRPEDVAEKYPVYKIEDAYNFEKYDPASSPLLYAWSWMQTAILLLLISWLFGNIAAIGSPAMFIYGAFVFIYVYAFSELISRNKYALPWELLKSIVGIGIIYCYGDWFGLSKYLPWINAAMILYFILALVVTAWFVLYDFRKDNTTTVEMISVQNV